MHTLDLPQSPRDAVFRHMEQIVRANPTFLRTTKPISFRTWRGLPDDAKEFTFEFAPAMRWTPMNSGEEFKSPDTLVGDLLINCQVIIRGNNCSDLTNYWWMITRCFYPSSQTARQANITALQQAGARTGLVLFSQPAFDPSPDGVYFQGTGQLKIAIESRINT